MAEDVVPVTREYFNQLRADAKLVAKATGEYAVGKAKENLPMIVAGVAGLGMYVLQGDMITSTKPGKGIELFNKNKYLLGILLLVGGWWFYQKRGKAWGLAVMALGAVWLAKVYKEDADAKAASAGTTTTSGFDTEDGEWMQTPGGASVFVPRGMMGSGSGMGGAWGGDAASRVADGIYGRPG